MTRAAARVRRWLAPRPLLRDQNGASAVEFGIIAPVLVFALLTTMDLGLAVHERMEIDTALRAGAEAAMGDLGEAKVLEVVTEVAGDHFTVASAGGGQGDFTLSGEAPLSVAVERFCACPEARATKVTCSASNCADSAKPYVYYKLEADKQYEAVLLPSLTLDSAVQVQAK